MKSMTGYGRSRFSDEDHEIEIEIKSVNNRFLDVKYKLPKELSFLETKFDEVLNKLIKRGKIQVNVDVKYKKTPSLSLNVEYLKAYWELHKKAAEILEIPNDSSLSDILAESEVISLEEENPEDPVFLNQLLYTFNLALSEHQKMALQEGESMQSYLLKSSKDMLTALLKIENEFPQYKNEINEKMKTNIESLLRGKLDEEALKRVMLEAAVYIEKADVTEEIVRLKDHIKKLNDKVKQNDAETGKSINFILQEMQRESNTIGSKFNSTKVFTEIILIKEEVEKCREIVQNVE